MRGSAGSSCGVLPRAAAGGAAAACDTVGGRHGPTWPLLILPSIAQTAREGTRVNRSFSRKKGASSHRYEAAASATFKPNATSI